MATEKRANSKKKTAKKTLIRKTQRPKTKLALLIEQAGLSQYQFQMDMWAKTGIFIYKSRLSNIINGKQKDFLVSTASAIALTLDVPVDDILEKTEKPDCG